MKNRYSLFFILAFGILLSGFKNAFIERPEATVRFEVPENINVILDQSCVQCHNKDSENLKGKKKLNLDTLGQLKISKQISMLSRIANEIEDGEMPPEKYLKKNPDKGLSEEEEDILIEWARTYARELAK